MHLVKQRKMDDCTIACLAMYSGKSYEEIIEVMKSLGLQYPLSNEEDMQILRELGHKPIYLKQWVWQTKGILTVPSLNIPTAHHVVCWSGDANEGYVLDPQAGNEGKKIYTNDLVLGNTYFGWAGFLTDATDEFVEMFAKMEIEKIEVALGIKTLQ